MAASRIHLPPPCPRDPRHLSVTIDTHQCLKMSPPLLTGASGPCDGETQKIWVPQNIFQLMTHSSSQSICYWHPIIIPMFLAHFSVILYLVFYICDFDELRIVKKNLYTCVFFSITYSFIFIYYDIHLFRTLIFNKHFNTDCPSYIVSSSFCKICSTFFKALIFFTTSASPSSSEESFFLSFSLFGF